MYGGVLGFLPLSYTSKEVAFRVSNNVSATTASRENFPLETSPDLKTNDSHFQEITSQVLGALLTGLYPTSQLGEYAALVQVSLNSD